MRWEVDHMMDDSDTEYEPVSGSFESIVAGYFIALLPAS